MAESRATAAGTANGTMNRTVAYSSRMAVQGGTVRVIQGPEVPPVHLGQGPIVIGRSPECGLVLADERVSATHVELLATDRGVRVRDLGSTNGTRLGDHAIVEALLTTNATLTVGQCVLEFTPGELERVPLSKGRSFGPLVGAARSMRALFERLRIISASSLSVLVQGETGTGKEVVAEAIHKASERADGPFVVVDCSALPASLAESTLFGHEKGAFTGAMTKRLSPFVEAKGGTIFLDELGELPLELQPKLLRVLADHRIK
ncbi:MAG TPA: sigma-54-dependent Fis family transcriptional regulator, partial [Fimbriimonadaceae bacterium]|nr:sigma-54-dependent Fis family transcriptional regulator [Fimbriimonadaceae bacterium]